MSRISFEEAIKLADGFEVTIGDSTAIGFFTNGRVNRDTLPTGWFAYDIRGGDDNDFCTLEKRQVVVNHTGTFLTETEIPFGDADNIELAEDNWSFN